MTLDEGGSNTVRSSLLFFAGLVSVEETEEQGCKLKKDKGCFPSVAGVVFECPDIYTCPESSK